MNGGRSTTRPRGVRGCALKLGCRFIGLSLLALVVHAPAVSAQDAEFVSDGIDGMSMRHEQEWGDFGLNTAAAAPGRPGAPLRIGDQTYGKGLGHHANGEITIDLGNQYGEFMALAGVQWQGGGKGSVVFRVLVDGRTAFECGPMSDSDPPREIHLSVAGARELRLVALDGGDGIACDMANWAEARVVRDPSVPRFGTARIDLHGQPAPPFTAGPTGFAITAEGSGPQVATMASAGMFTVAVCGSEEVRLVVPLDSVTRPDSVAADVSVIQGGGAEVILAVGEERVARRVCEGEAVQLVLTVPLSQGDSSITLTTRGIDGEAGVRWRHVRCTTGGRTFPVPVVAQQRPEEFPPPSLPEARAAIEQELIEWDWRMQDGIGTNRESRSWDEAIEQTLCRGDGLIQDLKSAAAPIDELASRWELLRAAWSSLRGNPAASEVDWENLWREVHRLRRRIVLANPLADFGPLLFVKQVPASFSHQITQYYGMCARPGGGVFVLENPGSSLRCRQLTALPTGSCQHPEISFDARRILFSFCEAATVPPDRASATDRVYHLYEMAADGSDLRQLTDGPYDDFSPRYLPDGRILFLSTRRGGYHRCGQGPCPVYTLAVANADGSDPTVISFHETHEWDPAVLNDGRIIYTRWDYVDRHAVYYQQLWTARPDGSNAAAYYGNNTLNPVGVWEARPVPDSTLVMATAGAHHAMTAGSIILLDVDRGIDGLGPVTRITPDVLFPESESPVKQWHAPAGVTSSPVVPAEQQRWPGHCYRSPYPLSKDYFLAAYSFDALIGEPFANTTNMFGIYLVDRFGNKELLYRDLNISSLWPTPLRPRRRPPVIPSLAESTEGNGGIFFVQNVYDSWPALPRGAENVIEKLRIVQVLPKSTPHANNPRVGLANASPGKQVLGTVPVERDGSAYFRAPARVPLAFQALDRHGMAVQTMRSLTYLQPGERASCIGCHEHRGSTPSPQAPVLASQRPPSSITPAPEGSRPLSYPILVQPVLDRHCVRCHGETAPEGGINLTGSPAGAFSASYNALAPLVPFSEWKSTPQANAEPLTQPNLFGARASKLTSLLVGGHEGVVLSADEMERLVTWMDANALFYGSFDPHDQQRQQRGERILGPPLE